MFKSVMCLEFVSIPVVWSNKMVCPDTCYNQTSTFDQDAMSEHSLTSLNIRKKD